MKSTKHLACVMVLPHGLAGNRALLYLLPWDRTSGLIDEVSMVDRSLETKLHSPSKFLGYNKEKADIDYEFYIKGQMYHHDDLGSKCAYMCHLSNKTTRKSVLLSTPQIWLMKVSKKLA